MNSTTQDTLTIQEELNTQYIAHEKDYVYMENLHKK